MFWRKSFDATFKQNVVEVHGQSYTVRELSVGERAAFLQYHAENQDNPLLSCAWLIAKACAEFAKVDTADISLKVGPSTIDKLSTAIIEISGLNTEEAIDDEVKN